jgi:ABC-type polysaccharide/polyol phosphate export permease
MNGSLIFNIVGVIFFIFILLGQIYFKFKLSYYENLSTDKFVITKIRKATSQLSICFSVILIIIFAIGILQSLDQPQSYTASAIVILLTIGVAAIIGYSAYSKSKK